MAQVCAKWLKQSPPVNQIYPIYTNPVRVSSPDTHLSLCITVSPTLHQSCSLSDFARKRNSALCVLDDVHSPTESTSYHRFRPRIPWSRILSLFELALFPPLNWILCVLKIVAAVLRTLNSVPNLLLMMVSSRCCRHQGNNWSSTISCRKFSDAQRSFTWLQCWLGFLSLPALWFSMRKASEEVLWRWYQDLWK